MLLPPNYQRGSEWQNDFANLPDYYQTFFRNYDQALGRFIAIDPLAEESESLTGYQYSVNNPIMFNDPLGDMERQLMEMPKEDCGCGGGGSGSGGGMNAARAFIKGIWAAQDAERAAQQNLMDRARAGDPVALSMYAQQNGAVTYKVEKLYMESSRVVASKESSTGFEVQIGSKAFYSWSVVEGGNNGASQEEVILLALHRRSKVGLSLNTILLCLIK